MSDAASDSNVFPLTSQSPPPAMGGRALPRGDRARGLRQRMGGLLPAAQTLERRTKVNYTYLVGMPLTLVSDFPITPQPKGDRRPRAPLLQGDGQRALPLDWRYVVQAGHHGWAADRPLALPHGEHAGAGGVPRAAARGGAQEGSGISRCKNHFSLIGGESKGGKACSTDVRGRAWPSSTWWTR